MTKRLYIETVGCQMNVLDSELVAAGLLEAGYELVDQPRQADTILFNTCSVRQHAEDKIYSALGRLKHVEGPPAARRSWACWAAWRRRTRRQIFRRAPHVDLVVGPGQLSRLPALLAASGRRPPAAAGSESRPARAAAARGRGRVSPASIRRGRPRSRRRRTRPWCGSCSAATSSAPIASCPRVRGPEQSRPAAEIEDEVRRLADQGCLRGDAAGPDGQQLPGHQRRPDRAAGRPAGAARRHRRACGG